MLTRQPETWDILVPVNLISARFYVQSNFRVIISLASHLHFPWRAQRLIITTKSFGT